MKVTTYETLYHEDHGATLKHKCGKRIVTLPLLSFSLIFSFFSFLFVLFFFFLLGFFGLFFYLGFFGLFYLFLQSGVSSQLVGESQSPSSFPHWGNALIKMIITLLFTYNSILQLDIQNKDMTLYECLRRCTGMCNDLAQQ